MMRFVAVAVVFLAAHAAADPCGMVPPIYTGLGTPITRVGPQRTYVFYKDGMETYVIRPGFRGKVEEFGMLIPFPSPPAMRKVSDAIFPHLASAIEPPEVIIEKSPIASPTRRRMRFLRLAASKSALRVSCAGRMAAVMASMGAARGRSSARRRPRGPGR